MIRSSLILLLTITTSNIWSAEIVGVSLSNTSLSTRLVFDLDNYVKYHAFILSHPTRLVIDLKNLRQTKSINIPNLVGTPIRKIRYAMHDNNTFRLVLDLNHTVKHDSQVFGPNSYRPYRLVLNLLHDKDRIYTVKPNNYKLENSRVKLVVEDASSSTRIKNSKMHTQRDSIIAIDAGHGGQDSGAIGKLGAKEKDVVLAIAKCLEKLVNNEPRMEAVLTRDKDEFITLRQRIKLAHNSGADMFISIHADAFHNQHTRGASVYVLSESGASSEAVQLLADKENAADLAGGISLEDKDDLLASVLLDLSQTASLEVSIKVANNVLSSLRRIGSVHKGYVESAAFAVLKSPDIPSLLVETAFISNPYEESKLISTSHQDKLAHAILDGIRSYLR